MYFRNKMATIMENSDIMLSIANALKSVANEKKISEQKYFGEYTFDNASKNGFTVIIKDDKDKKSKKFIEFNKSYNSDLFNGMADICGEDTDIFYYDSKSVSLEADEIYREYFKEMSLYKETIHFKELVAFLETEYHNELQMIKNVLKDGLITYDGLKDILDVGVEIETTHLGLPIAGTIDSARFIKDGPNKYYYVTTNFLHSIGNSFIQKQTGFAIKKFFGVRKINELDVRPLKPETKELLMKRGEKYVKYGKGSQFALNNGSMFTMGSFGPMYFRGDGRVMIDYEGMVSSNPRNDVHGSYNNPRGAKGLDDTKVNELLHTTWPTLHAFSFTTKRWGEIFVDNITDIAFDDHAFDKLVIDPGR